MGKMFNVLMLSGIISIVLLIFDGSGYLGTIAQMFISPQMGWGDFILNALVSALGISTVVGATTIIIGTLFSKQDWLIRAGMFVVLVSWIEAPFISLWQFVAGKITPLQSCVNDYTCAVLIDGSSTTTLGMVIASILIGPLILYALWACWSQIWSPESSG